MGRTVLPGLRGCAVLPHPPAPSRYPLGTAVARPHLSAIAPASLAPRRPGADAACPSRPPLRLSPLFLPVPALHVPPGPSLHPSFPSVTCLSVFKSHRSPSRSPFRPAPSHPRSSTPPPPPSSLDSIHRPRTLGSPRSPTRF
jgi:hypothetical protein